MFVLVGGKEDGMDSKDRTECDLWFSEKEFLEEVICTGATFEETKGNGRREMFNEKEKTIMKTLIMDEILSVMRRKKDVDDDIKRLMEHYKSLLLDISIKIHEC